MSKTKNELPAVIRLIPLLVITAVLLATVSLALHATKLFNQAAEITWGNAAKFQDVYKQWMWMNTNGATNYLGTEFTIEGWYKPSSLTKEMSLFWTDFYSDVDSTGRGIRPVSIYVAHDPNNRLIFQVTNPDNLTVTTSSTTVLALNTWHHFAAEKRGNNLMLFLDGNLEDSKPVNLSTSRMGSMAIGVKSPLFGNMTNFLDGELEEFRLSTIARYLDTGYYVPNKPYIADNSTKVLLHMEQKVDYYTPDSSGNNNIVQVYGPTFISSTVPIRLSAELVANPTSGTSPLTVSLVASPSNGIAPYNLLWNFGDGQYASSSSESITHIYTLQDNDSSPKTYTATVDVIDALNQKATASVTITVDKPVAPTVTAKFTANPTSGISPLTVKLINNSVSSNNLPMTYLWNFGDGTTSTAVSTTHTFTVPKKTTMKYAVSLTATDSEGRTDTYSQTITVSPGKGR